MRTCWPPQQQGVAPSDYIEHLQIIRHTLSDGDIVGIGNLKIRRKLWSADSAAWKLEAYYNGGDNHDLGYARRYSEALVPSAPLFQK